MSASTPSPCLTWTQLLATGHALPPRYGHSAATFFNGTTDLLLVYGGRDARGVAHTDLHVFDPLSRTLAAQNTDGAVPVPRSFHSAIQVGRRMVLFGGLLDSGDDANTFALLDARRNPMNWADRQQVLERAPVYRRAGLWPAGWGRGVIPTARQASTVTAVGRRVLYFGGEVGVNQYARCVFQYDFEQSTWSALHTPGATCIDAGGSGGRNATDAPAGRAAASLTPHGDDAAVLFGGSVHRDPISDGGGNVTFFNDAWLFIATQSTWRRLPTPTDGPSPRDAHAAAIAPGDATFIIVYGGRGCRDGRASCRPDEVQLLDDAWRLSPSNGTWARLSACNGSAPSGRRTPGRRAFHTLSLTNRQELVLIGGQASSAAAPLGDVWSLQWQPPPPPTAPARVDRHLPLPATRESVLYTLLYVPALDRLPPRQYTLGMDDGARQALRASMREASVPLRAVSLSAASGDEGTLAQYALLLGSAFAAKAAAVLRQPRTQQALSDAVGTPVNIDGVSVGEPLPMRYTQSEPGADDDGGLSAGALAGVIVSCAALALAALTLAYLLFRRRRRRSAGAHVSSLWAELAHWWLACIRPESPRAHRDGRREGDADNCRAGADTDRDDASARAVPAAVPAAAAAAAVTARRSPRA